MADVETPQERKLRLTHTVQKGQAAEELLDKFADDWIIEEGKQTLLDLLKAKPDELIAVQAGYQARTDLYALLRKAVSKGKRAAEELHKEATSNG